MTETERKKKVIDLTSFMMHQYYCENQQEAWTGLLDESFHWIGAGEQEYAKGKENMISVSRGSLGKMLKYTLTDEEYQVVSLGDQVYVCSGRVWITADSSQKIFLRVHQRITAIFRFQGERAICCHIHMSNPCAEMDGGEKGVSLSMIRQTYQYLQDKMEEQKRFFQKKEEELLQICYEDSLTRVYNRNRFDKDMNSQQFQRADQLGIGYFDVNNLKKVNDTQGHSAGDQLICQVAEHIRRYFNHKTYRIGGDEFVVIDTESGREHFENVMRIIGENMRKDGIDCSQGFCWRDKNINMQEQFNEADQKMYEDKKGYYKEKAKEED